MTDRKPSRRRSDPPVGGHPRAFKPTRAALAEGQLHLRDARVDLDGRLYATGHMSFGSDDDGLFPVPGLGHEIGFKFDNFRMRLGPYTTERDPETGFLNATLAGPIWELPQAVSDMIKHSLKGGARNPVQLSGNEAGFIVARDMYLDTPLADPRAPVPPIQYLSEICAQADDVDGVLKVRLSAALRHNPPKDPTHFLDKKLKNYWSIAGDAKRIEVTFAVDPMTQSVRCGKLLDLPAPPLEDAPFRAPRTLASALRLENALIGWHHMFGISDWGGLVHFADHEVGFVIEGGNSRYRRVDGLLADTDFNYNMWPRIWLWGMRLETIGGMMKWGSQTRVGIVLRGVQVGKVEYTGGPDARNSSIVEAELDFELTAEGLAMSYNVVPEERDEYLRPGESDQLSGRLIIAWEMLALRFPQFLRHRQKFVGSARR